VSERATGNDENNLEGAEKEITLFHKWGFWAEIEASFDWSIISTGHWEGHDHVLRSILETSVSS
jgi:hypothetical protein